MYCRPHFTTNPILTSRLHTLWHQTRKHSVFAWGCPKIVWLWIHHSFDIFERSAPHPSINSVLQSRNAHCETLQPQGEGNSKNYFHLGSISRTNFGIKYKLRWLGHPNQIIDDSDSKLSKYKCWFHSDSKSDEENRIVSYQSLFD